MIDNGVMITLPDLFMTPRETLLDRLGHAEAELWHDVPEVPPLCDELPRLRPHYVDVGDARLFVEEQGDGVPLVLLHGGPGASHHSFHPAFSRLGDDMRVIYYDQRGCWRSDHASGDGYSVAQSVDDLEALRQALGIRRWTLLGHSYGGYLAQCYASTYPSAVAGLVLVCAVIPVYEAALALQPSRYPEFLSAEETAWQERLFADASLAPAGLMYNIQLNGRWKRQNYYRPTRDTIARIARYEWVHDAGYYDAVVETMYRHALAGIFDDGAIPTLLCEGRWDLVWNAEDKPAAMLRHHPQARLELFEASGHAPFNDEPERFFPLLETFLHAGMHRLA